MAMNGSELKRVAREQAKLYDAMVRSIWGDRVTLALTAAAMGGMGLGLLFSDKWGTRFMGALMYATAAGMETYAAMSPKTRGESHGESPMETPRAEPRVA